MVDKKIRFDKNPQALAEGIYYIVTAKKEYSGLASNSGRRTEVNAAKLHDIVREAIAIDDVVNENFTEISNSLASAGISWDVIDEKSRDKVLGKYIEINEKARTELSEIKKEFEDRNIELSNIKGLVMNSNSYKRLITNEEKLSQYTGKTLLVSSHGVSEYIANIKGFVNELKGLNVRTDELSSAKSEVVKSYHESQANLIKYIGDLGSSPDDQQQLKDVKRLMEAIKGIDGNISDRMIYVYSHTAIEAIKGSETMVMGNMMFEMAIEGANNKQIATAYTMVKKNLVRFGKEFGVDTSGIITEYKDKTTPYLMQSQQKTD